MSVAMENSRIEQVTRNGYFSKSKISQCNLSLMGGHRDRTVRMMEEEDVSECGPLDLPCSSSSSSIGRNSDDDEDDDYNNVKNKNKQDDDDEDEVQSALKESSFDSAVDALEQALPIRRGISKFYNGKSKSFASLSDAARTSIKEITKPENAYTRKRKNLLACSLFYDKGRTAALHKSPGIGGGIMKRSINPSRSSLALAMAMDNPIDENEEVNHGLDSRYNSNSTSPSVSPPASPHHPHHWRSFSLADLQHCAVSASVVNSNLSYPFVGKRTNPDEVS